MPVLRATNQMSLVDLTDGYSVDMSPESYTFHGTTTGVNGTQTITCKIRALCGGRTINATVGSITTPSGLTIVSDGVLPSPTLTITATTGLSNYGSVEIPVSVDGNVTIVKFFSWSIAFTGATGQQGEPGAAGRGIVSVTEYYLASSQSDGVTVDTAGWTTDVQSISDANRYLWNYEVTTYTSGNPDISTPCVIGVYGRNGVDGADGIDGQNGNDGRGITSVTQHYLATASSSNITKNTYGWTEAIQSITSTNKYLWNYETTTYSDGQSVDTVPHIIGTYGDKGDPGSPGSPGAPGAPGADGADAITITIESSNGIVFKDTTISTTLTARVYKGGVQVTGSALSALGTIKWYKNNSTTETSTGSTLTVNADSTATTVVYTAKLEG